MSTVDNSVQLNESLIETEARLLSGDGRVDLKLYERNSMNKINLRSFVGKNYICSCQDKYRKIRVPITALLLKILETKNDKNTQRLQKIKLLIYTSQLQNIVKKQPITTEELLSNFAQTINQLEALSQKIQPFLIKKLNSEPFFDKVIMESFFEMFYDTNKEVNLTARISKWIKSELGISIVFVQNQTQLETESIIFLRKNQKNEVLRQLKSFNISSMSSIIDDSKEYITPLKVTNRQLNQLQISEILLKSITSIGSPVRRSSRSKVNQQLVAISIQNSLELFSVKENSCLNQIQKDYDGHRPIKKRRAQQHESRFWKIFCCGAD